MRARRRVCEHREEIRLDADPVLAVSGRTITLQEIHLPREGRSLASQQLAVRIESEIRGCVRNRLAFEYGVRTVKFLDGENGRLRFVAGEDADPVGGFPFGENAVGTPHSPTTRVPPVPKWKRRTDKRRAAPARSKVPLVYCRRRRRRKNAATGSKYKIFLMAVFFKLPIHLFSGGDLLGRGIHRCRESSLYGRVAKRQFRCFVNSFFFHVYFDLSSQFEVVQTPRYSGSNKKAKISVSHIMQRFWPEYPQWPLRTAHRS